MNYHIDRELNQLEDNQGKEKLQIRSRPLVYYCFYQISSYETY